METVIADQRATEADERLVGSAREDRLERLYRRMVFIRRFEETVLSLFDQGLLNGTTHACIGQEADCVGVIEHLRQGDHIFSNHRCHGHYLAWTGDAQGLLAEMMGLPEGACSGLGGSQHLCAAGFKSNGVLGGTVPAAAGIALAHKLRGSGGISVAFIGDGTLGEGVLHETLNIASLWKLPLFVVVENNEWSQSTPIALNLAGRIADRLGAFGIPLREIATTDVVEVDRTAAEEIATLRRRQTPRILLIHTYRLCSHSRSDDCRPEDEVEARRKYDPLLVHGKRIEPQLRRRIESEVDEALGEIRARIFRAKTQSPQSEHGDRKPAWEGQGS